MVLTFSACECVFNYVFYIYILFSDVTSALCMVMHAASQPAADFATACLQR